MCGITGIFSYGNNGKNIDQEELIKMRDAMLSRGPDGEGIWIDKNQRIGLAHRRLAIIDLSENARQPMSTVDGQYHIVFNGEIYNYQLLRKKLIAKGYRFFSNSDTEVLLNLYIENGPEMLKELRGMYAFAIWDSAKRGLFLARDPFGIKPLYMSDDGHTLRFASQVRALLQSKHVQRDLNPAGQVGFFLWGCVPEPHTMFKSIQALEPGATHWIDIHGKRKNQVIIDFKEEITRIDEHPSQSVDIREIFADSIKSHLIADVDVGLFLSAGLDSSTVAAFASKINPDQQHTLTLGFKEFVGTLHDETILAEQIAKQYGTKHQTIWIEKETFRTHFANFLEAMDQPTVDGINTYFVSMAAAKTGLKVALSGLGGDELFRGYDTFFRVPFLSNLFRFFRYTSFSNELFRKVSRSLFNKLAIPKYAGIFEYGHSFSGVYLLRRSLFMPWELDDLLDREIVLNGLELLQTQTELDCTHTGIQQPSLKVTILEFYWYMRNLLLRDVDWASMAHSLEIRVPFLDLILFRNILPLLASDHPPSKMNVAQFAEPPLPKAVLTRKKTGFRVPIRNWLMAENIQLKDSRLRGWAKVVYNHYISSH